MDSPIKIKMKTKLIGIVAMDPNRVIGKGLTIPWHYSEDFKFFKKTTLGHPIVMGRKTFESLGNKPLPKRLNVVISSTLDPATENIAVHPSIDSFLHWLAYTENLYPLGKLTEHDNDPKAFIIGGSEIYRQFFPLLSGMYVTHIKKEYDGDVFMPQFEELFDKQETVLTNDDFEVKYYEKINNG